VKPTFVLAVVATFVAITGSLTYVVLRHDQAPRRSQNAQTVENLDQKSVQRVVEEHGKEVKLACWEPMTAKGESSATVRAQLVIDAASGRVVRVTTEGTNPSINSCVEQQASGWVFPRSREGATINIPFTFVRNQ
jgi:hypothetical protein